MNAEAFSKSLLSGAPNDPRFRRAFQCRIREDKEYRPVNDPLMDFIANYDLSTLEAGGIEFYPMPKRNRDRVALGWFHGDELVIDDKGLVRFEASDHRSELDIAARNTDMFLDALLIVCRYFAAAEMNPELYEDEYAKRQAAQAAALAAGGEAYLGIYEMLLSV